MKNTVPPDTHHTGSAMTATSPASRRTGPEADRRGRSAAAWPARTDRVALHTATLRLSLFVRERTDAIERVAEAVLFYF